MNLSSSPAIAFIGVGLMGHGIVGNLLKKGFTVTALEHPGNRPMDDLMALGLKSGSSIAELVADADVVFICVSGSPEVEDVMLSPGGVLEGIKEGAIVVDCSTAEPARTLALAEKITAAGCRMVDAPMTRTAKEAEEGRLNVMVGGDDESCAAVLPLLQAYAENIYRCGEVGTGHKLKLIHNFLSLGNAALVAEAVTCATAGGVDLATFNEVMLSGGGDSVVFRRLLPYINDGDDGSFQFALANGEKDLRYYVDYASGLNAPHQSAIALHGVYNSAVNAGLGGASVPHLIDHMKEHTQK